MSGFLLDNDVFFAALYEGHENHVESRAWLDRVKPDGWGIAVETFLSAMRLLMNPAIMGRNALSGESALTVVSSELGGKNPATVVYATALPDMAFFKKATGHKQVMDLWLVQLAVLNSMQVATRDKPLARNCPDVCFLVE